MLCRRRRNRFLDVGEEGERASCYLYDKKSCGGWRGPRREKVATDPEKLPLFCDRGPSLSRRVLFLLKKSAALSLSIQNVPDIQERAELVISGSLPEYAGPFFSALHILRLIMGQKKSLEISIFIFSPFFLRRRGMTPRIDEMQSFVAISVAFVSI